MTNLMTITSLPLRVVSETFTGALIGFGVGAYKGTANVDLRQISAGSQVPGDFKNSLFYMNLGAMLGATHAIAQVSFEILDQSFNELMKQQPSFKKNVINAMLSVAVLPQLFKYVNERSVNMVLPANFDLVASISSACFGAVYQNIISKEIEANQALINLSISAVVGFIIPNAFKKIVQAVR